MPRALIVSGAALLLLSGLFVSARQAQNALDATAFVCPMHPDFTLDIAGTCPRCGMALVRATPFDVRDYGLEFRTAPALVRAGQTSTWRFDIRHPGTGEEVQSLELVHERPYHLFVISQDMTHFQHIHPEQQPDKSWTIDVTLPTAWVLPGPLGLFPDRRRVAADLTAARDRGIHRRPRRQQRPSRA